MLIKELKKFLPIGYIHYVIGAESLLLSYSTNVKMSICAPTKEKRTVPLKEHFPFHLKFFISDRPLHDE